MKFLHLIMITILALSGLIGCVPKSRLQFERERGYKEGRIDCIRDCAEVVYSLRSELKKSQDKAITVPGKKWSGDSWEDDVTGKEAWQK